MLHDSNTCWTNITLASIVSPSSDAKHMDFLPQGIAVDAKNSGGAYLVASGCRQSLLDERPLYVR